MKDIHAHLRKSPAWSEYRVAFQLQIMLAQREADRLNSDRLEKAERAKQKKRSDPVL